MLSGSNTSFPMTGGSKKQSCVSHSTPEAEIVAADTAVRTVGIPALDLWDAVLGRKTKLQFLEDNQTMITVCQTGKNQQMRHLGRTHGVQVASLHQCFKRPEIELLYITSNNQAADIFTKGFTDPVKWAEVMGLIQHVTPNIYWKSAVQETGGGGVPSGV